MQRKSVFIFGFILILLLAAFVTLRSNSAVKPEQSTCCEKPGTECTDKKKNADDLLPENLSHQFIIITKSPF